MRGIHYKGMRGKSNVIKSNVEKVWGACIALIYLYGRSIKSFVAL
jgi:hypothetical protein